MKIDGNTKIIGFFGSTYKTSKMYGMYNAAFETLGLNYTYVPFVVNGLKKAVEGVRNLGIHALGVTIPYKIEIIKYLDKLDKNARRIGAVNSVINSNGRLIGSNTDGLGAVKALEEVTILKKKKIILLGSGGAARAVAFAVKDSGGNLLISNRSVETGHELADTVNCQFIPLDQLAKEMVNTDILINATSVGMAPNESQSLVADELFRPWLVIMDLVTNPQDTRMLKGAKTKGCKIVYGKRMLFWQAVLKFKLFTGIEAPVKIMEEAINA